MRAFRILTAISAILAAAGALAQAPVTINITGNLSQIAGSPQPYGGLSIQLQNCPGPVAITGYSVIVQQALQLRADASGVINASIWPNDEIDCNGTTGSSMYALVPVVNGVPSQTVQCYQVTAAQGTWNLNTQQPIACTQTPPNPQDAQYRNLNVTSFLQGNNGAVSGSWSAQSFTDQSLAGAVGNCVTVGTGGLLVADTACQQGGAALLSGAVFTGPIRAPVDENVVYAQSNETAAQAVSRLLTVSGGAGGIVRFGIGTWQSGGLSITTPHVTIEGSGMPTYNPSFTAMVGGTIIQGTVAASQGADNLVLRNLGVDVGSDWAAAHNGGAATDAISISNAGQVIGAPLVQFPVIEHVSCLGFGINSPNHCMLVENVNGATVHDVQTVKNQHGLVIKGSGVTVDGVWARGHGTDGIIVKSDNYAPASVVNLTHVLIMPLLTPGDTKGIFLLGLAAPLQYVTISDAYIQSPLAWGIMIQGANVSTPVSQVNLSNIFIDYPGASPTSTYCLEMTQWVTNVNAVNFNCSNMWAGIAPNLPSAGVFNDFSISNSHFTNIATNAIESYGRWQITNSAFISVSGDCILNDAGTTMVDNNQYACGASSLTGAGVFGFGMNAQVNNSGQVNFPAALYAVGIGGFGSLTVGGGALISNSNALVQASSPTVGKTSCIKAAGPPVVIGFCSTVVDASGACTCN